MVAANSVLLHTAADNTTCMWLYRYDKYAFDRMYQSAVGASAARGSLAQLTFLRMGNRFLDNWDAFNAFMARMRGGED